MMSESVARVKVALRSTFSTAEPSRVVEEPSEPAGGSSKGLLFCVLPMSSILQPPERV